MTIFHATPYDISATGFYFETLAEYEDKASHHRNDHGDPVEEYEIQFIDGDDADSRIFFLLGVTQATLPRYFELQSELEPDALLRLEILIGDMGHELETALEKQDDLIVYGEISPEDWARDYLEDTASLEALGTLACYFDYEAFARDCLINGDIAEHEGILYDPRSV